MSTKVLPFSKEQLEAIVQKFPTPFHIYDEKAMRENARRFVKAFSWNKGFKEFFAIKACPNPYLMKALKEEGFGIDCSSMAELVLAEQVGLRGEEIMFTSNDTPAEEFVKARELGAIINLDDIRHIEFLEEVAGLPELVCFRYNPGALKEGNVIIGHPEEAKYGFTREQLFEGYKMLKKKGLNVLVCIPWLLPMNWILVISLKQQIYCSNWWLKLKRSWILTLNLRTWVEELVFLTNRTKSLLILN